MKRYKKPFFTIDNPKEEEAQVFIFTMWMFWLLVFLWFAWWIILRVWWWLLININDLPRACTPSQEHQQLSTQLSGMSSDINILLQLSEIK